MRRKVCVVITARPSYARIRSTIEAIRENPDLELQLIAAASTLLDRYGNAHRIIERDGFRIDRRVYMIVEGENPVTSAKSTGLGLAEMATALDDLRPDVVVTVADRFETMATAVAAAYLNVPLAHVQGGEISGSIDEKVRHAITKLADLHFVATAKAAERVIRMGERPETVFVTGCPSIDLVKEALRRPALDFDLFERYGGVGSRLDLTQKFIVVMQHPVTTEYASARRHMEETLYAIKDAGIPTLWFWPNVDAGSNGTSAAIRGFRERFALSHLHLFKNLPPEDFIRVLYGSRCIVGNSSVAIRECSYMGIPAVNIGTRQLGRERARNVVDVAYDREAIGTALRKQCAVGRLEPDHMYGNGGAGREIAELLARAPLTIEKRLTY